MAARIPAWTTWMSRPNTNIWQPQERIRLAYSGPRGTMPQGFLASAQIRAIRSMASKQRGFSKSPGTPRTWLRSAGPTKRRSTSGTAAISAASFSAEAVSIWMPMKVEALALAAVQRTLQSLAPLVDPDEADIQIAFASEGDGEEITVNIGYNDNRFARLPFVPAVEGLSPVSVTYLVTDPLG